MCAKASLALSNFSREDRTNIKVRVKPALAGSKLHGHDFYELDIIAGGESESSLNGKDYEVCRGQVHFLTPADFHNLTRGKPLYIYNVHFAADSVSSRILERLVSSKRRIFVPDDAHFDKIIHLVSIMESLQDENFGRDPIISRLLECILLLLTASVKGGSEEESASPTRENKSVQKAIIYIHEHFKENPPLPEIAAVAALNERYFCTCFREYTGKTYKEYLKELKLSYARRLLLVSEMSVTEIAESSGYATQSHFNREFKNYYGVSPLKMRAGEK